MTDARDQVLIGVDDLVEEMLGARPPVVLDVRWQLGDDAGHDHYRDGHLPGAVYVDLDTELAAPPSPEDGRHPLPAIGDLQEAARRWGIDIGVPVVVYDDWNSLAAARAWWLLRWGGLTDVRILDGGLAAWRDAGLRISSGDATPRVGNVVLTEGGMPTVDIDRVALASEGSGSEVLLDARAPERFRGEEEPIDPRPGHIPGAVSAPTTGNVDDAGLFKPTGELVERFATLGAEPGSEVVAYCGSGVTATHQVAALTLAGIDAALYPGSYSQWSNDPSRDVATA